MVCVMILVERARVAGMDVCLDGGRLVVRGPRVGEAIAKELLDRKAEAVEILKAEAENNALHRRIFELIDAAEANDLYGAHEEAAKQRAEVHALVGGKYWRANERLLDLLGPDWWAELDRYVFSQMQEVGAA